MAKVSIIPKEIELPKVKRVAAYCRVSTDKDAMLHSLSNQVSYFSKLIQKEAGWEYVGVYLDEGVTGTKGNRRGFSEMIEDAKSGKMDIIVTKSLSRFARNTVDCLKTIRELKEYGVDIFFEEQNIHTLSTNGEFMISLLAGFAQEESRNCSENVLWRVKKNFEEGLPFGGNSCLGYKLEKGKYEVVASEAIIVRRIFDLYLEGNGSCKIARILNEEGIKSYLGGLWNKTSIMQIITNPVYKGTLVLQKTYIENHLTKRHKTNRGEKPMYVVENNHEAIVTAETFDKAQAMKEGRANRFSSGSRPNKSYVFTGMIRCGICGKRYKHKITKYYGQWICDTYDQQGKRFCPSHQIRDDVLKKACAIAMGVDSFDEAKFKENIEVLEAFNNNLLVFHFKDGTTKDIYWEKPSRKDSWTTTMKNKAKERSEEYAKRKNNTKQD